MVVIFLDIFFLIGMLAFGAGAIKLLLDNILYILLGIVILILLLILISKFPKVMLICLTIFAIVVYGGMFISDRIDDNDNDVSLCRAIGECKVYDIDGNIITIPAGAIIAKYHDWEERRPEGNYAGFAYHCHWYYNGEVHHAVLSNIRDGALVVQYNNDDGSYKFDQKNDNLWNIQSITEIKYGKFRRGDWWKITE